MRPLYHLRCSSSVLTLTIVPLLTASLLGWSALPSKANIRARYPSSGQMVPTRGSSFPGHYSPHKGASPSSGVKSLPAQPDTPDTAETEPLSTPAPASAPAATPGLEQESSVSDTANETVTIPKSSAIIVSFPAEITLDPKRQHNVPMTLPLMRPVVDADGNIVIPAKSLAIAQLKSMPGGDLIEVTAVVVGGRVVPINAIGTLVPAQKKPEDYSNQYIPSPGPLNNTFNSLSNWQLSSNYLSLNKNARLNDYIGIGLAVANGLTTPTPKSPPAYVNITQGSIYILTLANSVTLPKKLVDTGIELQQNVVDEPGN
jgi:hypothetical protein